MLGLMFCVLVSLVCRRYRGNRNSNRRKLKNSDENLVEVNQYSEEEEEEIFNIRLHNIQESILTPVSPEECDINIIQDPTISSTTDEIFSLWLFFRNLLK